MTTGTRTTVAKFALLALVLAAANPAQALQSAPPSTSFDIGPSRTEVAGVVIGIAAVGAGIGIGVYYATHHNHTLTGCAATAANGLELVNEGDRAAYALIGDVAAIKPGNRVRVSGKKEKKAAGGDQPFLVEKVSKDFGACKVQLMAQ